MYYALFVCILATRVPWEFRIQNWTKHHFLRAAPCLRQLRDEVQTNRAALAQLERRVQRMRAPWLLMDEMCNGIRHNYPFGEPPCVPGSIFFCVVNMMEIPIFVDGIIQWFIYTIQKISPSCLFRILFFASLGILAGKTLGPTSSILPRWQCDRLALVAQYLGFTK